MERNEDVRLVAIAFATTEPSPKRGGRISELVAIEKFGDQSVGRILHPHFKTEKAQLGKKKFSEQFKLFEEMVGDSKIILYNAHDWRKFFREELRFINKPGARKFLEQETDVVSWARKQFPRQRKGLLQIANRLQIDAIEKLGSLEDEARLLLLVSSRMHLNLGKLKFVDAAEKNDVQYFNQERELKGEDKISFKTKGDFRICLSRWVAWVVRIIGK